MWFTDLNYSSANEAFTREVSYLTGDNRDNDNSCTTTITVLPSTCMTVQVAHVTHPRILFYDRFKELQIQARDLQITLNVRICVRAF